eukprot:SAG25_NODE_335_length_9565_cov_55.989858_3_plen_1111_part_00
MYLEYPEGLHVSKRFCRAFRPGRTRPRCICSSSERRESGLASQWPLLRLYTPYDSQREGTLLAGDLVMMATDVGCVEGPTFEGPTFEVDNPGFDLDPSNPPEGRGGGEGGEGGLRWFRAVKAPGRKISRQERSSFSESFQVGGRTEQDGSSPHIGEYNPVHAHGSAGEEEYDAAGSVKRCGDAYACQMRGSKAWRLVERGGGYYCFVFASLITLLVWLPHNSTLTSTSEDAPTPTPTPAGAAALPTLNGGGSGVTELTYTPRSAAAGTSHSSAATDNPTSDNGESSCWSRSLCHPVSNGTMHSGAYHNSEKRKWKLTCPREQPAFLRFTSQFSTEANFDFVSLYAGATESEQPMIGGWSGHSPPAGQFGSEYGKLLLVFVSDASRTDEGFTVEYACGGTVVKGCTDSTASGYIAKATLQDATCIYDSAQQRALLNSFVVEQPHIHRQQNQPVLHVLLGRGWDKTSDPCGTHGWQGVRCDRYEYDFNATTVHPCLSRLCKSTFSGALAQRTLLGTPRVSTIDLSGYHFTYQLGISIAGLTHLRELRLDASGLVGTLPPQLAHMQFLNLLSMDHTRISGTIPQGLGEMSAITTLSLASTWLSGSVPQFVSHHLKVLDLDNNALTTLPGKLPSSLSYLYLGGNPINTTATECGNTMSEHGWDVTAFTISGFHNAHIIMQYTQSFEYNSSAYLYNTRCHVEQCNGPRVLNPRQCELGGACEFKLFMYDGHEVPARIGGLVHDLSIGFNCTNAGGRCAFPFQFKNERLNRTSCMAWSDGNDGRRWCPLESSYVYHNQAHGTPFTTPWGYCNSDATVDTVYYTPTGGVRRSDCSVAAPMRDNRDGTFSAIVPPEWTSILSPGPQTFHFFHEDIEFIPTVDSNDHLVQPEKTDPLRTVDFRLRCPEGKYDVTVAGEFICIELHHNYTTTTVTEPTTTALDARCKPCPRTPEGLACAVCSNGAVSELSPGWHLNASDRNSFEALLRNASDLGGTEQYVYPCLDNSDCPALKVNTIKAVSQQYCSANLRGRLCTSCKRGYTRAVGGVGPGTDKCKKCQKYVVSSLLGISTVLIFTFLLIRLRTYAIRHYAEAKQDTRFAWIMEAIAYLPIDQILPTLLM